MPKTAISLVFALISALTLSTMAFADHNEIPYGWKDAGPDWPPGTLIAPPDHPTKPGAYFPPGSPGHPLNKDPLKGGVKEDVDKTPKYKGSTSACPPVIKPKTPIEKPKENPPPKEKKDKEEIPTVKDEPPTTPALIPIAPKKAKVPGPLRGKIDGGGSITKIDDNTIWWTPSAKIGGNLGPSGIRVQPGPYPQWDEWKRRVLSGMKDAIDTRVAQGASWGPILSGLDQPFGLQIKDGKLIDFQWGSSGYTFPPGVTAQEAKGAMNDYRKELKQIITNMNNSGQLAFPPN